MSAEARKQILADAESCVCRDRNATYGPPEDSFAMLGRIWSEKLRAKYPGFTGILSAQEVALMLADLKIARAWRNPHHRDSWVDLAGYAACGGGMLPVCEKCEGVARHLGIKCVLCAGHTGEHASYDHNGKLVKWNEAP